jgi:rhamnulokinase
MGKKTYLAFDLGASSGRAVAGFLQKDQLTTREVHRFKNGPVAVNDHLYWNIYQIFTELLQGLRGYEEKIGEEVDGIGVDSWGVDYCLFDCQGNLLGNPFHYRDSRTTETPAIIDNTFGSAALYDATGIQLLPFNTLNQLIASVQSGDPRLSIANHLLFIADTLHYFLSGRMTVEFTAVSISQLYNNAKGHWEDRIFDAFEIPAVLQGKIVQAGSKIGPLLPEIMKMTGFSRAHVIAPAVHDTASAAVSVPVSRDEGWAFLSSGTWSILGLEIDSCIVNDKSRNLNISNTGGVFGKNLLLKNVMGLWIIQQCRRHWQAVNKLIDYEYLVREAFKAQPFTAFIDPDDLMFLNVGDMPAEIVKYCAETGQHSPDQGDIGTISRIVFESLALKYRVVLEQLTETAGRSVDVLYLIGGGSKNALLNQFTADALDRRVCTGPVEASSIGNILMQAAGDGLYHDLPEIRQVVINSFDIGEYLPRNQKSWNNAYKQFKEIL